MAFLVDNLIINKISSTYKLLLELNWS